MTCNVEAAIKAHSLHPATNSLYIIVKIILFF